MIKKQSFGSKGLALNKSMSPVEIRKLKRLLQQQQKSGRLDPRTIRAQLAQLQKGSVVPRRKIGGSVNKPKLSKAFKELKKNPPSVLRKTRRKKGKARAIKQRVAIAYSKARKRRG